MITFDVILIERQELDRGDDDMSIGFGVADLDRSITDRKGKFIDGGERAMARCEPGISVQSCQRIPHGPRAIAGLRANPLECAAGIWCIKPVDVAK